jgi:prephenate dehydrogenase
MTHVAVVGLGLIGGSLALALRAGVHGLRVTGIDVGEVLASDLARAATDELVDVADGDRVAKTIALAQFVVLATPVRVVVDSLPHVLDRARVVTDCGSTKRAIVAAAASCKRRGRFVPGHPMAGRAGGGMERASAELFRDRAWILCPDGVDADALADVERLVTATGARIVHMAADEHDRAVALTSHVPQLLASALVVMAERGEAEPAAGPAFENATRVAGGPEAMWRDIFHTNADEIAAALRELGGDLVRLSEALAAGRTNDALELLRAARKVRSRP